MSTASARSVLITGADKRIGFEPAPPFTAHASCGDGAENSGGRARDARRPVIV